MTLTQKKNKTYIHFVGIDISKHKLDFAVCQEKKFLFHALIKNEEDEIHNFINRLKELPAFKLSRTVFCLENTGFYGNHLLKSLHKLKVSIVQEHPLRIKNSMGLARGKDDKNDAIAIANYAWMNRGELNLWIPRREIINEIAELMAMRNRLLGVAVALKNPQKEKSTFINKHSQNLSAAKCKNSIIALTNDLSNVEKEIKTIIMKDERLTRLMVVITSVPFIGFVTAVNIIICTNEYKDITDPKKFACYAGIAPFPKESGKVVRRRRISYLANRKMKALLHVCAVGAATRNEELKIYFNRKVEEGKPKFVVFNAVRYKLVLRVFACLRHDRLFTKEYRSDKISTQIDDN